MSSGGQDIYTTQRHSHEATVRAKDKEIECQAKRIEKLVATLNRIYHWPMNRDAVKALGLCQHEAKKAIAAADKEST